MTGGFEKPPPNCSDGAEDGIRTRDPHLGKSIQQWLRSGPPHRSPAHTVFSVCLSPVDSTKFCVLMARMWHETRLCYPKSCSRPGRKIIASLQPICDFLDPPEQEVSPLGSPLFTGSSPASVMIENGSTQLGAGSRSQSMQGGDQRPIGSEGAVRQRAEGPKPGRGGGAAAVRGEGAA